MKYVLLTITVVIIIVLFIILPLYFGATPAGKTMWNNWFHAVQKADDNTNYKTLKEVENTCRAMISSYKTDKSTYEQYKDNKNSEKQGWGEQAKMRANKTANIYNEYILKNSYIWKHNVPPDIFNNLEIIK
jgi:ABC-type multidrug transport system fused ATPase/permease subunit